MSVGKYSYGYPTIKWNNPNSKLIIGNFCSIAADVTVYLGNGFGHDSKFVSTYPFGYIHQSIFTNARNNSKNTNGDVIIGNDVWIGENVIIMSGVRIGDGAIIANNSHVVKNVEPYSLAGGNPAKHIKYRFTKNQIDALLKIQWWNWSDEKINRHLDLLTNANIDEFIRAASA
jgi:acetyltransferase-like isoleucine patch superfamily enzyme